MVQRGHKIPVHKWWLRLARSLVNNDARDLITLGKDLGKHVKGRKTAFNYTQLSRFSMGQTGVTLELAEALCKEYSRLPLPFLFPRSYEESVHLVGTAEKYGTRLEAPIDEDQVEATAETGEVIAMRRSRRRGVTVRQVETPTEAVANANAKRRAR